MSSPKSRLVSLRVRCCRCGRVDRFTVAARAAFALAERLLKQPCLGEAALAGGCNSRDLRVELKPGLA